MRIELKEILGMCFEKESLELGTSKANISPEDLHCHYQHHYTDWHFPLIC